MSDASDEAWADFTVHMFNCAQCRDLNRRMCIEGAILLLATDTPDGPSRPLSFTTSSGNVFADLGLPDADELLRAADAEIESSAVQSEGLTREVENEPLG